MFASRNLDDNASMELMKMAKSLLQAVKAIRIKASLAIPVLASLLLGCGAGMADESPFTATTMGEGIKKELPKLATPKEYFARALEENNRKDYDSAIKDYSEAIRLNPHYGEAIANRGSSLYNNGDVEGSLRDFNEAVKIFPTNKAVLDLKAMAENTLRERANNQAAVENQARQAAANQMRAQMMLGGDFSDPSTMIMMNAQRRGLVSPQAVDYSDPASIIMMNAKRRGLVPQNTPNP